MRNHQMNIDGGRIPSLDGWRALSILLVLAAHSTYVQNANHSNSYCEIALRMGGSLGVRFFFVISGFLITLLLLREGSTSDLISLKQFYWRRAFRILPVYFLFLGTLMTLQCLGVWRQTPRVWFGVTTFTFNFIGSGEPWVPGHLWSLAIEEQFYLIWPAVLVFIKPWKRPFAAFVWLLIPIISCPIFRSLAVPFPNISIFSSVISTFTQADPLAYGCLGAIAVFVYRERIQELISKRYNWLLFASTSLIVLPHILFFVGHARWITHQRIFMLPFEISSQSTGFLLILVLSIFRSESQPFKLLNSRPIIWIGTLSYSVYIWQQLFCGKPADYSLSSSSVWWMNFPGWFVPTFAVATFSYYCVELPFLKLRKVVELRRDTERRENTSAVVVMNN